MLLTACSLCEQGRNVEVTPAIKEHVQSKGPQRVSFCAYTYLALSLASKQFFLRYLFCEASGSPHIDSCQQLVTT